MTSFKIISEPEFLYDKSCRSIMCISDEFAYVAVGNPFASFNT